MKKYLYLFRGGDAELASQSPEQSQAHMQRWMQWMQVLADQGRMLGADPLARDGKVVSGKGSTVTDGPYMEGKEIVGGYLIVKADSYDEAVSLSKGCPILDFSNGMVEVREIQSIDMM